MPKIEPASLRPTAPGPQRRRLHWTAGVLWLGLAGLVLPGCSSAPKSSSSGGASGRGPAPSGAGRPGSSATGAATSPSTAPAPAAETTPREQQALAAERQWLQAWFKDTPVRIVEEPGRLTVEVPIEFAFDTARSEPKPPLLAVLDKMSQSLRRQPQARLALVAAPDDGNATTPLSTQRAAQVRRYLIARGVVASRLAAPASTGAAALQMRMEIAAP